MRKTLSGKLQNIPMGPIPENQSCNSTAYLISLSFKPGKTNTLQKIYTRQKRNCRIKNPKPKYLRILKFKYFETIVT
jgi:hypothetical protein